MGEGRARWRGGKRQGEVRETGNTGVLGAGQKDIADYRENLSICFFSLSCVRKAYNIERSKLLTVLILHPLQKVSLARR